MRVVLSSQVVCNGEWVVWNDVCREEEEKKDTKTDYEHN